MEITATTQFEQILLKQARILLTVYWLQGRVWGYCWISQVSQYLTSYFFNSEEQLSGIVTQATSAV